MADEVTFCASDSPPVTSMSSLPYELIQLICKQATNVLEPRVAVNLSSASKELRVSTQAVRQQLLADHKEALALCLKVGMRSCKQLREAKTIDWRGKDLSAADVALLGTLGSVLPALQSLSLFARKAASLEGVQRLSAGLGAGALPAVTYLSFACMRVGDAGASALAAALGRGALPRLETLNLASAAIDDAGLVALAPALRRRAALEHLILPGNPLGDEGLGALVPPPPAAGAAHPPTGRADEAQAAQPQRNTDHRRRLRCPGLCHVQLRAAGTRESRAEWHPCRRHGKGRCTGRLPWGSPACRLPDIVMEMTDHLR